MCYVDEYRVGKKAVLGGWLRKFFECSGIYVGFWWVGFRELKEGKLRKSIVYVLEWENCFGLKLLFRKDDRGVNVG